MGRKKPPSERPARSTPKAVERAEKPPEPTDRAPRLGGYGREYTLFDFGYAADAGASAHYQDPSYYAATYENRRHDVAYYAQKARLSRGPVLEYGIGNGRVALHVAR